MVQTKRGSEILGFADVQHLCRLKIGISQGRPDSIQPDHLGRADYHGDCVNRLYSNKLAL
eukprot:1157764-Pelagomonas_calceolata.AAC.7